MQVRQFLFMIGISLSSTLMAAVSHDIAGRYHLQGAMDMASELLLKKDGTFTGGVLYGSAEGYTKGTWRVDGEMLLLQSEADPAPRMATDISFDLGVEIDLAEASRNHEYDNERGFDFARNNYVLEMEYSNYSPPTEISSVDVFLEFDKGDISQLLWRNESESRLSLPFESGRTLKKIGFRNSGSTAVVQWFSVSSKARWLSVEWKKNLGSKIYFEQPYERDLSEAEYYFQHKPEVLEYIQGNYLITMHYAQSLKTPAIKPVSVYWRFTDGFEQQQVWADSKEEKLLLPLDIRRALKKVGFQEQGSIKPIQWLDVSPTGRWFSIYWQEHYSDQDGDLSSMFDGMTLEIQANCLALDLGNSKACFRK